MNNQFIVPRNPAYSFGAISLIKTGTKTPFKPKLTPIKNLEIKRALTLLSRKGIAIARIENKSVN